VCTVCGIGLLDCHVSLPYIKVDHEVELDRHEMNVNMRVYSERKRVVGIGTSQFSLDMLNVKMILSGSNVVQ